jgi:BarA-like signal transduction histidine kinase
MGTLHEDQYTIFYISPNSSQNKKCFRQKLQRKPKHTIYAQKLFSENRTVYEIMWKNIVQPDRRQMAIWRMYISCWKPKITDTLTIQVCKTYWFSTAKMVKRACHSVTLHVHCLSCSLSSLDMHWIFSVLRTRELAENNEIVCPEYF